VGVKTAKNKKGSRNKISQAFDLYGRDGVIRTLDPLHPIHGVGRYARGQGGDTLRVEILGAAQVAKFLCFARSYRIGAKTDLLRLGLLHLTAHAGVIVESPAVPKAPSANSGCASCGLA